MPDRDGELSFEAEANGEVAPIPVETDAVFAAAHPRLASQAAERPAGLAGRPSPERGASLLDWYA